MKERSAEYYRNNAERVRERNAEWRRNNAEKMKEYQAEYYRNNAERVREHKAEWRRNNAEKVKEYQAEYYSNNAEKVAAHTQRRRARKRSVDCGCINGDTRTQVMNLNDGKCAYCPDGAAEAFEHVIALSKGGKNCIANGLPACKRCNSSKGTKDLHEWLKQTGRTMQYTGELLTCPTVTTGTD